MTTKQQQQQFSPYDIQKYMFREKFYSKYHNVQNFKKSFDFDSR